MSQRQASYEELLRLARQEPGVSDVLELASLTTGLFQTDLAADPATIPFTISSATDSNPVSPDA